MLSGIRFNAMRLTPEKRKTWTLNGLVGRPTEVHQVSAGVGGQLSVT